MAEAAKQHLRMEHMVSLHYSEELTPLLSRFGDHLLEGKLIGHRGSSGMVYMPPKGYDPMTCEPTTDDDEVEVSDHGTVSGYTIITPVQYYGQQETKPFVYASVLLDGAVDAHRRPGHHEHRPRRHPRRPAGQGGLAADVRAVDCRTIEPRLGRPRRGHRRLRTQR